MRPVMPTIAVARRTILPRQVREGQMPLRRFIKHDVETRIGRALLAGDVRDGAVIRVGLENSDLTVTYENPA